MEIKYDSKGIISESHHAQKWGKRERKSMKICKKKQIEILSFLWKLNENILKGAEVIFHFFFDKSQSFIFCFFYNFWYLNSFARKIVFPYHYPFIFNFNFFTFKTSTRGRAWNTFNFKKRVIQYIVKFQSFFSATQKEEEGKLRYIDMSFTLYRFPAQHRPQHLWKKLNLLILWMGLVSGDGEPFLFVAPFSASVSPNSRSLKRQERWGKTNGQAIWVRWGVLIKTKKEKREQQKQAEALTVVFSKHLRRWWCCNSKISSSL